MERHLFPFTKIKSCFSVDKIFIVVVLFLSFFANANAQVNDTTPPEIVDFNVTPLFIDSSSSAREVTVTIRATDAESGVREVNVTFLRPGDDIVHFIAMYGQDRISGNDKDGVYRKTYTWRQTAESGIYNVSVHASDMRFNGKHLHSDELARRGFVSQFYITSNSSADSVSIRGQVYSKTYARFVDRALVTLTDANGEVKYAVTNPFGYYRFNNVKVGATYTLSAAHKKFTFAPQTFHVYGEMRYVDIFPKWNN